LVIGDLVGYFKCNTFIYIVEEALRRNVMLWVDSKQILLIVKLKGTFFPSHALYTDDDFVFCRTNKKKS